MTENARRRALQAAAKLAAVTLAACAAPQGTPPQGVGPKTPAPADAGNVAASPEAEVTVAKNAPPDAPAAKRAATASSDPSKASPPHASPPTQGPPPPGRSTSASKPASPEEIKACVGKLDAAIKTGSGPLGPRLATAPSLKSCCELLVHERKGRGSVFFSCCMALGDNSPACTPWGPPMPPTMPEAAAVAIV